MVRLFSLAILLCSSFAEADPIDLNVTTPVSGVFFSQDGSRLLYTKTESDGVTVSATLIRTSDLVKLKEISGIKYPATIAGSGRYIVYRASNDLVTIYDSSLDSTKQIPNSTPAGNLAPNGNGSVGPVITDDESYLFYLIDGLNGKDLIRYKVADESAETLTTIDGLSFMSMEINRTGDTMRYSSFTGGNTSCLLGSVETCLSLQSTTNVENTFCSRGRKSNCFRFTEYPITAQSSGENTAYNLRVNQVRKKIRVDGRNRSQVIGYAFGTGNGSNMFYIPKANFFNSVFGTGLSGAGASSDGRFVVFGTDVRSLVRSKRRISSARRSSSYFIFILDLREGTILKRISLGGKSRYPATPYATISGDGSMISYPLSRNGSIHTMIDSVP